MRVGILVPSVYMFKGAFTKRVSAPMQLSLELADNLVKRGIEVYYFSAPDIPTKAKVISTDTYILENNLSIDYQQDMNPDAYKVVSSYETKKYFELDVTEKCYDFAKNNKIDIVHVYHAYGNLAHYFTELLNIPTLYTLHVLPPPVNTLEHWRYKRFQNQNFIAISNSQKRDFHTTIPGMNIMDTVYHGVSLQKFQFSEKTDDYFSIIGRLVPQKGLDVAMQIALQAGINLKVVTHLTPVTEKSEYYQKKILPLLNNQNIQMLGLLNDEKKINLLQHSKAFLFPLQWNEPFGMVIIEAMACGTPVIAYNRGSVSEIVRDGLTGFIIEPEDSKVESKWIIKKKGIEGFLEAIKRIGEIDRKNCRKHVEENFTSEKTTERYENIYRRLVKGGN